ncbi:MAG: hypothetical protein ACKVQJ_03540 [Pyrinomonadaceae bacterium]
MDLKTKIISELAKRECQRISTSVIRRLQKLKGDSLLSGDDSGLRNTWDEICVQIQGDLSYHWDVYLVTMQHIVETTVNKLDADAQMAIWLQTEQDYVWDPEDDEPKTVFEDVVNHIFQNYLFVEASEWSNSRIGRYIDQH